MWNIKAGGAEPGKVEGGKGEWWNRMRYVGKSRRQKVEKKSKDLPERKDLRLGEKLNQGGKMVSIFSTALGQLRMIWSWPFVSHTSVPHLHHPHKTLPLLPAPWAKYKRYPNQACLRKDLMSAACTPHLPARAENWAKSDMYLPLHLIFMAAKLVPVTQPAWSQLLLP